MKVVEIYKLENNGDQTILATCSLEAEVVMCEGEGIFVENLKNVGISNYTGDRGTKERLLPEDGLLFLENLKYAFRSGYLMATDVLEK